MQYITNFNFNLMTDFFTFANGILNYKNVPVTHNGVSFQGSLIALIFDKKYCFVKSSCETVNEVIEDYMQCTGETNFEVQILNLTI